VASEICQEHDVEFVFNIRQSFRNQLSEDNLPPLEVKHDQESEKERSSSDNEALN
jgi:hypothetical protein